MTITPLPVTGSSVVPGADAGVAPTQGIFAAVLAALVVDSNPQSPAVEAGSQATNPADSPLHGELAMDASPPAVGASFDGGDREIWRAPSEDAPPLESGALGLLVAGQAPAEAPCSAPQVAAPEGTTLVVDESPNESSQGSPAALDPELVNARVQGPVDGPGGEQAAPGNHDGEADDLGRPLPPPTAAASALEGAPAAPATVVSVPDGVGRADGPGRSEPTQTARILDQIAPGIARVSGRGDGIHRLQLRLHPADLGEVHLTVTVRGSRVDVQIAASAEARDALREGSAQLRGLLESVGRTTGQLVFRDLPVSSTPPVQPPNTHAEVAADAGGGSSDGSSGSSYAHDGGSTKHGSGRPAEPPSPSSPRSTAPTVNRGSSVLDVTV